MCLRVTCSTCGKPSFAGCGRHVESVLRDVTPAQRCRCSASSGPSATRPAERVPGLGNLLDFLGADRKPQP